MFKVICSKCQHLKVQSQNEMHVHLYLWTRRSWAPPFENSSVVIAHLNVLKIHCDFPYFWSLRLLFSKNIYCCSCCHGFCFLSTWDDISRKHQKLFIIHQKLPQLCWTNTSISKIIIYPKTDFTEQLVFMGWTRKEEKVLKPNDI